jgi:hypothetical protein
MTLASPKLPAIQPVAKAGGGAIKATNGADWMLVAHGRAWVGGGPRQGRRGLRRPNRSPARVGSGPPGPVRGRVVRRIGAGEGSGSAGAGAGQLWISAHDVEKLYRVPVR